MWVVDSNGQLYVSDAYEYCGGILELKREFIIDVIIDGMKYNENRIELRPLNIIKLLYERIFLCNSLLLSYRYLNAS